jgi:hypothetical protein
VLWTGDISDVLCWWVAFERYVAVDAEGKERWKTLLLEGI